MNRNVVVMGLVALFLCSAMPARAALVTYPMYPGLVYDSTQDITWLMDANYAKTTGYAPPNGVMTWYTASAWADSLVFVTGGTTFDQWRLPDTPGTGNGVTEGEMGELYLLYGITSDNPGPFINLTDQDYWTSKIVGFGPAYYYFTFNPGYLKQYSVDGSFIGWDPHAMAVFDGAPDASPVPDPGSSLLLLGVSLAGLRAWKTRLA